MRWPQCKSAGVTREYLRLQEIPMESARVGDRMGKNQTYQQEWRCTAHKNMGLSENRLNPYTQWFCWSLSRYSMAISLGILTQHFQTYPLLWVIIIPSKSGSIIPYSNQFTRVFLMAHMGLTVQIWANGFVWKTGIPCQGNFDDDDDDGGGGGARPSSASAALLPITPACTHPVAVSGASPTIPAAWSSKKSFK